MSFDDFDMDNPVSGKGEEMIPDRGIPFEDDNLQDMLSDYESENLPIEISEDELGALMSAGMSNMDDRDGGMSAGFPMAPEDDFDDFPALPQEEIALPMLDGDLKGGVEMAAPPLAPGLGSVLNPVGNQHFDAEDVLLTKFVTEERLQMLWQRLDQAQRTVRDTVPNIDIAKKMLDQIEQARNEFLASIENYEEVERLVGEVELRLVVIKRSIKEAPIAMRLFIYEFAWALVFSLTLLALRVYYKDMDPELGIIFFSMGLAGLGSVVRTMYTLWQHTAKELNFSSQYSMWYIIHPILGPFLGIFVFLVMRSGSLTEQAAAPIKSPYSIYLFAFLMGFQQNVAWKLMRRLQQVFFPENEASD